MNTFNSTWLEISDFPGLATFRRHGGMTAMPATPGSPHLPLILAAAATLLLAGCRLVDAAIPPMW